MGARLRCASPTIRTICASSVSEPTRSALNSSVPLLFDRSSPAAVARAQRCYTELLERGRRRGFVPYRVHVDAMDWLTSHPSVHWQVIARLKKALDPHGIFSPGRYAPLNAA